MSGLGIARGPVRVRGRHAAPLAFSAARWARLLRAGMRRDGWAGWAVAALPAAWVAWGIVR